MNLRSLTSRSAGIVAFLGAVLFELFRSDAVERIRSGELPPRVMWGTLAFAVWQAFTAAVRAMDPPRQRWTLPPPDPPVPPGAPGPPGAPAGHLSRLALLCLAGVAFAALAAGCVPGTLSIHGARGGTVAVDAHLKGAPASVTDDCAEPPFYPRDGSGPACSSTRAAVPCECSEVFFWTPQARATYYVIERSADGGAGWRIVGAVDIVPPGCDGEDCYPGGNRDRWSMALDSPAPVRDVLYSYRVRACNAYGCSDAAELPVPYRGAPLACFDNGAAAPCW